MIRIKHTNNLVDFQYLKYNEIDKWKALKAGKQNRLDTLDYSLKFDRMLGNYEVRSWYIAHNKKIPSMLDGTLSLKDQAMQAHELRNTFKQQARDMMIDMKELERLVRDAPLREFSFYVDKYRSLYKSDDDLYRALIDSSTRSNKEINKLLGLEG
ncbi:MAG: hypothetical protein ACOX05_05775 [Bacillota bacterium]